MAGGRNVSAAKTKTLGPACGRVLRVLKNLENQKGGIDPWGDRPAEPLDSEVGVRPGVFEGGGLPVATGPFSIDLPAGASDPSGGSSSFSHPSDVTRRRRAAGCRSG